MFLFKNKRHFFSSDGNLNKQCALRLHTTKQLICAPTFPVFLVLAAHSPHVPRVSRAFCPFSPRARASRVSREKSAIKIRIEGSLDRCDSHLRHTNCARENLFIIKLDMRATSSVIIFVSR